MTDRDTCDLSRCFLCRNCLPEWNGAIATEKQTLYFKKGRAIFREGEEVRGIYFVYDGAVKIHQYWGGDKDFIVRFATFGDVLGHRGQTHGTAFPVSATALDHTRICFIRNEFLESTFKTNTSFLYAMMQLYAGELQRAESRMRSLAVMPVKGRVAEALFTIQEVFGLNAEGYISVPITRLDIACYAGTAYEAVFRLFTKWSGEGIVSTQGKYIRIIDEKKLREFIWYPE